MTHVTVPIAVVKAHTEDATSHMVAATAHVHPLESTATALEKMSKSFLIFFNLDLSIIVQIYHD